MNRPPRLITPLLTTREAGNVVKLSARTLYRFRVSGHGPVYYKFGNRIRYRMTDLIAWADKRQAPVRGK